MKKSWLDELIKYNISMNNIQCCVTQVNYLGEIIYECAKGFGTRDGRPVHKDTIFQVTSLTKPIIAALILLLFEDGKIHLDHLVGQYLSSFQHGAKSKIRIIDLLTHTSGLLDAYPEEFLRIYIRDTYQLEIPEILDELDDIQLSFFENMYLILGIRGKVNREDNPKRIWSHIHDTLIKKLPPYYATGTQFIYCNYGYNILSQIITLVTNTCFESFAFERLLEPLGMSNTFWKVPESKFNDVVKRYKPALAANWLNSEAFMKRSTGYDGLKSTVTDMMAFIEMIKNRGRHKNLQIFSEKSIYLFMTNHNQHLPKGSGRTVGFHIHDEKQDGLGSKRSQEAIDHGGMGGTQIMIDPKYGISIVFFAVDNKKTSINHYDQFVDNIYSYLKL